MNKLFPAIFSVIIIGGVLFSFFAFNSSSSKISDDNYVIVRVIECKGGDTGNESKIFIHRGGDVVEEIDLDVFNKKGFKKNFQVIGNILNGIKAEGYQLVSASGGGGDDNGMIMQNYIFEK